ncbi:hypothetical protein KBZ94_38320 [Streptomyces sp. RM72]|uniref:hypothetical protein n=1 Tax=Streptomyces sp. RM72 TaxID=1115510 RepID=UPI001B397E76|nr:hypothetical protein [Streptomyces sp. RM72]MBQ0890710.1 hypothetical protein [Streptomyces sp. RM72]
MTPRQRTLTATVAACAALGTLSACGSDPTGPRGTPAERATAAATAYVTGLANGTANPETMCELETTTNRPNFSDDGGTLAGCITAYQNAFRDRTPTATPATVTVGRLRDVPATATLPAGKEALVTVRKDGPAPWSYVLRLTEEQGHWRVARLDEAGHAPTEPAGNPVAQTLERAA